MGVPPVGAVLLLLLLLAASWEAGGAVAYAQMGGEEAREEEVGEGARGAGRLFMMERPRQVVRTEAGEVRVARGFGWKEGRATLHVGFISMEPNSLFLPQYMDATLILFVRRGEAKVGWIYEDRLVEKQLKAGDLYWIPAGSTFYIANTGRGQRLQIICGIDTSDSSGLYGGGSFQGYAWPSHFIGGGSNPPSLLAGFDVHTLATAFNVTSDQVSSIMRQRRGAIIYTSDNMTGDAPESGWTSSTAPLLQYSKVDANPIEVEEEDEVVKAATSDQQGKKKTWILRGRRKQLPISSSNVRGGGGVVGIKGDPVRAPDAYNIYEQDPDFSDSYGWSVAVDEDDYEPLERAGLSVYFVNLTAGSMMAPHVNPTAAEYGVVLRGTGRVQVAFPNGTSAMDAVVGEGDAWWVPRHFPVAQVASRSGPMVFFGFATSASRNRRQFLVGDRSILHFMMGPEMAAAFGTTEERLRAVVEAQRESIILPPRPREQEMILEAS